MLADAGLVNVTARTFLLDLPSPLDPKARQVVRETLAGQLARVGDRISRDDQATLVALLDDDNPQGVMRRSDLFVLGARTIHLGTVP